MKHWAIGLAAALVLVGCSGGQEADSEPAREPEGRAETRNIRNTEAIGYSGGAIADKVDSALTTNEEYKKKQDAEIDEQME